MPKSKSTREVSNANNESRRDRAARIQSAQRQAERRRALLVIGPAILVAVAMVGSAAIVLLAQQRDEAEIAAAAGQPIDGVRSYPKLSRNHVTDPIDYPQEPPVGGDHAPVWTNCGVYEQPVDDMQTVHSLEHGAVWLSHPPDLAGSDVSRLADVAEANSYVLVAPNPDQKAAIVATAWGKQLTVNSADDPKLATFVQKYQQGPQTPEPGAACTGGVGGM